ncbi:hypothetical protein HYPSUDRAFT_196591 [Hypholoma sublateritium FD-334 SS-4]|uniref:Uncharacterized protein n=1 Tax=Hypholoma sublateritium (strain FD-334 SS-4) TaxID=945553 RepID=A0A0D2MYP4_HYPSF|nr:hypothetical protein HYPSUDRAFT_196591 [Hypholoma sublateritium FD-334 SS-4]
MGSVTHGFTPLLPGAWASTWTLSPEQDASEVQKTPRLAETPMPYSVSSQDIPVPAPETPNSKALGYDAGPERSAHIDDDDSDAISFEDDDSSVLSEDFYSFISHEDTDTTLPSSVMSMSPTKELGSSEGLLGPLEFSGSHFDYSQIGSSLRILAEANVLAPDAIPPAPEAPVVPDTAPSTTAPSTDATVALEMAALALGRSLPNLSACGQQLTTCGSPRIGTATRSLSGASSGYEGDSASAHSDDSDINYRDTGVATLSFAPSVGNAAHPRDRSGWEARPRSSSLQDRSRAWRGDDSSLHAQHSALVLEQPDGDNPWTLFLDPTLTATEDEAVSRSSVVSLSRASSFAPQGDRVSVTSVLTFTSVASLRFTPSGDPYITSTPIVPQRIAPQQETYFPVYDLPAPLGPPFVESGPSTVTVNPIDESIRSRNFLQKTKILCSKLKKLITLKAKKERKAPDAPFIHRTILSNDRFDPSMTPPFQRFPQMTSPSFSSVERPSTFRRSAKTSSPSVALSYTPEYTADASRYQIEAQVFFASVCCKFLLKSSPDE